MTTTGFESKTTADLRFVRQRIVTGVMDIGFAIARGETVRAEAKAMVPVQAALVASMDAELLKRGEVVPPPPWEE